MTKTVTIYKASAQGVTQVPECYPDGDGGYRNGERWTSGHFWVMSHYMGREYFLDRTEAALKAEELRLKKIDSLEKQLAKLKAAGPHITLFQPKE